MPANPQEAARFVRDPRFQSIADPQQQLALFRQYLAGSDSEYGQLEQADPQHAVGVAKQILDYHQPTMLGTIAREGIPAPLIGHIPIPLLNSAVRGFEGEPTDLIARVASGGYEAPAGVGRAAQNVLGEAGMLLAAGGVAKIASPALDMLASRLVPTSLEGALNYATGAGLADAALAAPTMAEASQISAAALATSFGRRITNAGLHNLTAGGTFAIADELAGWIDQGTPPPLSDFIGNTLGVAALGMAFYGVHELGSRFGLRSAKPFADFIAQADPERLSGLHEQIGGAIEAVRKTGRMDRQAATDLVFDAMTKPITEVGDSKVIRETLRNNPDVLGTEVGLHLLRTQRAAVLDPDIRFTSRFEEPQPTHVRVTFDDEKGKSTTLDLNDHAAQREFAKRVAGGQVVVDSAIGDQASVLRAGIRKGEPLAKRVSPGGGPARPVSEAEAPPPGDLRVSGQLPALVPDPAVTQMHDLVAHAGRELRMREDMAHLMRPALPEPAPTIVQAGGETFRLAPGEKLADYPKVGDTIRSGLTTVKVVGDVDQSGRVAIQIAPDYAIRVPYDFRTGEIQVPDTLLTLPERRAAAPVLTVPTPGERAATAAARLPGVATELGRAGELAAAERAKSRGQVFPGQVIHQTIADMNRRGVRDSIVIDSVDGERVRAHTGEVAHDTTVDVVLQTVENGAGKFGFDVTAPPIEAIETVGEAVAAQAERPIFDIPTTPDAIAQDTQLADTLWAFERRAGQDAGPATTARNEGEGLARKRAARENRPESERTKSKSDLVKGCKK